MKTKDILSVGRLKEKASMIIACLFFIVAIIINILPFLDGKNDLMDFGSFYASGLKIQNGENPYDPNSEYIFEINFSRVGAGGKMMNLNPPISVVLFRSLSLFDPHQSLIIWQIISAILYIVIIFALATTYKQNVRPVIFLWAFTLAGFWHTLVLGQIYILLLLFTVLGWIFLQRDKYILAGIAIGMVVAIKPNFILWPISWTGYTILLLFTVLGWIFLQRDKYILAGIAIGMVVAIKPNFILWPIFLLFSGYYVTFFLSVLSGLIVSFIPVIFYGTRIYVQWLGASALHPETIIMPGNNSILGLTTRFSNVSTGILISVILILILLILSKLKRSNNMEKSEYVSALGIIASLLASPISWTGYTILLLPIFFSLKKWPGPAIVSAAILSIPFAIVLQLFQTSFVNFILFGWLYGWGILLLLGAVVTNTMMTRSIQTN